MQQQQQQQQSNRPSAGGMHDMSRVVSLLSTRKFYCEGYIKKQVDLGGDGKPVSSSPDRARQLVSNTMCAAKSGRSARAVGRLVRSAYRKRAQPVECGRHVESRCSGYDSSADVRRLAPMLCICLGSNASHSYLKINDSFVTFVDLNPRKASGGGPPPDAPFVLALNNAGRLVAHPLFYEVPGAQRTAQQPHLVRLRR